MRGLRADGRGRARLLGVARLPQLRRPVARAAVPGRLSVLAIRWELAAGRSSASAETARVVQPRPRRPRLARPSRRPARRRPPDRGGRLPGAAQLLDRRSPPDGTAHRAHGRARCDDGEVSPYLVRRAARRRPARAARPDRRLLRVGRLGRGGPLLLVAGGSGVVPLMAMLRHRAGRTRPRRRTLLIYSSRTEADLIYREELDRPRRRGPGADASIYTLTREQPPGWTGYDRPDRRAPCSPRSSRRADRPATRSSAGRPRSSRSSRTRSWT